MNKKEQVWLVTGASSGFGRALVEELISDGYPVVATARKLDSLSDLGTGEADILKLSLDVTQPEQIRDVVSQAESHFGSIDVLVNNAGYGYFGAMEESDQTEVRQIMETNFWGANNMALAVLPKMRAKRSGRIINVTSIGGLAAFPTFAYYHATKFAMEGLFQSLRKQVAPLGIQVTNVEPGAFRTKWAGASHKGAKNLIDDYSLVHEARLVSEKRSGSQDGDPKLAAKAFIKLAHMKEQPMHYLFGTDAYKMAVEGYENSLSEFKEYRDDETHLSFGDDDYWKK
ncbi:short-chain dehydrogenase [Oenococcus oeni IOEB_0607]|uniref:oxidoreductase n=1 Tax=Oenococcus oeni TaxID=1247 RepID=UPI0005100C96|nr:oxidoreductase [Oenococcus oeni]KGH80905.1 short-chain dehydrogenase [Oenococcus oeni IOEB_0607]